MNQEKNKKHKRNSARRKPWLRLTAAVLLFVLGCSLFSQNEMGQVYADEIVVCIDAGHGGENTGAMYQGFMEKDLTIQIALAMQEELSKYQGVRVVMTRQGDEDVSLTDRAAFAEAEGADFVLSLHLNASAKNTYYGAEVWTSAYGEYNAKGRQMGDLILGQLGEDFGIYTGRGVKTKLGTKGTGDYYTVINESRLRGIPAVIVEHCYMDQMRDKDFWKTSENLAALGKADATAVAEYFGLVSEELGKDFRETVLHAYPNPEQPAAQDVTEPETCEIELAGQDDGVALLVTAKDSESELTFYRYSADGGRHWSKLTEWPGGSSALIQVTLPYWNTGQLCVKVYNQYDLAATSNVLTF